MKEGLLIKKLVLVLRIQGKNYSQLQGQSAEGLDHLLQKSLADEKSPRVVDEDLLRDARDTRGRLVPGEQLGVSEQGQHYLTLVG